MKGSLKFLRKRLCVIGLAAASVFAGIAAPMAVSTANVEVAEAGTNGHTRDWVAGWANGKLNTAVDYDGAAGVQCVDLIQMYAKDLGEYLPSLNAYQYATCALPNGWQRYGNDRDPMVGDIYIKNGNPGHVGVVVKVYDSGFDIIDYNWGIESQIGTAAKKKGKIHGISGKRNFYKIIRPDFEPVGIDFKETWYTIQSALGTTGSCLEVAGNSTANSANVQIWSPIDSESQIFYFKKVGDGYYEIINKRSGKLVDTEGNSTGRANVFQWGRSGAGGQQWKFVDAGDGYVYIRNRHGKNLDVANLATADGSNIQTWEPNGQVNQKWRVRYHSGNANITNAVEPGDYMIQSKLGNRVLNVAGDGVRDGDNICIWDNGNYPGNIFTVSKEQANTGTVYYIKNKNSGKVLDSEGNYNKSCNAIQFGLNKCYGQSWFIEDAGGGYVYIRNRWGLYLDVDHGTNANGTNVLTYGFGGGDNQKWKFVKYNSVTGVSLSSTSLTLTEGDTSQLYAFIAPSNANNSNITWSSSNTAVAKVENGKISAVKEGTATVTVKTAEGSKTATCTVTVKAKKTDRFSDVSQDDWYYKAVEWAAAKGIATGSNGKFFPAKACTREEAMTFLWRMAGKPDSKSMVSKFSDVTDTKRYSYKAIMWGAENGYITGSKGKFYPGSTCTREQIVTIIWRLAGKPVPKKTNTKFKDVTNPKSYSYKAIIWAEEQGIAKGSDGLFRPSTECKRRDIVTFIYRYNNTVL